MIRGIISILLCAAFLTSAFVLNIENAKANPGGRYYIRDDLTGGDCEGKSIGVWESSTKTCTLTTDVYETIQIDGDGITLDGNGKSIIHGFGNEGVNVYGRSGTTVKNVVVSGFFYGIHLSYSGGSTLTGNTVTGPYGIYLSNSGGSTLNWNTVTSDTYCIHLSYSGGSTLTGNKVTGGFDGIYLSTSGGSTLNWNMVTGGIRGINMYVSGGSTLTDNWVTGGGYRIVLDYSAGSTLTGNTVMVTSSGLGIFAYDSAGSTLTGNTVMGGYYGIYLYSFGSTLIGNTVMGGYYGIFLASGSSTLRNNGMAANTYNFVVAGYTLADYTQDVDTSNTVNGKPIYYWVGHSYETVPSDAGYVGIVDSHHITVQDLTLADNYQGVLFAYTTDSTIKNVVASGYHGIYLYSATGNTLTGNTVTGGVNGIYVYDSTGNTLTGNTVTGGDLGILLYSATGNTLVGNIIAGTTYCGIYLYYSDGNSFYYNSIIDNTVQLFNYASTNTWDDGDGNGNYWSDYTGKDDGSGGRVAGDGIGDTLLPHQGVDWYPLIEPWNPKYEVREVIEDVKDMGLPKGVEDSLVNLLKAALSALERGDVDAAINQLQAFINLVEAFRGKKLTNEQADYLHGEAQKIINELTG